MQGLGAGAVDTALFGAGSAGLYELFFESLTGSVGSDGGVAGCDAGSFGEGLEGAFGQIDFAKDVAVCWLDGGEDAVDALADDLLGGRVELDFGGQVAGPLFEGAIFGGAVAVVVDDGIAKDAVEPGYGGFVVAESGGLLHGADVGCLDDVFGGGAGGHAAFDELEELLSLVDEAGDGA